MHVSTAKPWLSGTELGKCYVSSLNDDDEEQSIFICLEQGFESDMLMFASHISSIPKKS